MDQNVIIINEAENLHFNRNLSRDTYRLDLLSGTLDVGADCIAQSYFYT